jgi:hypothetical protein
MDRFERPLSLFVLTNVMRAAARDGWAGDGLGLSISAVCREVGLTESTLVGGTFSTWTGRRSTYWIIASSAN